MVVTIIERLMVIGFSEYESKAWIALLRDHPSTAYETARSSGIPTAKIYPVLDKLIEREAVMEIEEQGKKRYVPCDPEDFLSRQKRKSDDTYESLSRDLTNLAPNADVSYIWNLTSYGSFLERAEECIRGANKEILLSLWNDELTPLMTFLKQKEAEGVKIAIVHFGKTDDRIGSFYEHPIADTLYAERGGRGFSLVADGELAMMGTISADFSALGAWSASAGFVLLAEDYIKHDIYMMKIVRRFDGELTARFGAGYAKLRNIFSDEEVGNGERMD